MYYPRGLGSTSKCNTRGKSLARVPRPHPPLGVEGDSRVDQAHLFDPPK